MRCCAHYNNSHNGCHNDGTTRKSSAVVDETVRSGNHATASYRERKKVRTRRAGIKRGGDRDVPGGRYWLYGWGNSKQPRKRKPAMRWRRNWTALQKASGRAKSGAGRDYQKQAAQLEDANRQQAALAKQLDEVQQKSPIPAKRC